MTQTYLPGAKHFIPFYSPTIFPNCVIPSNGPTTIYDALSQRAFVKLRDQALTNYINKVPQHSSTTPHLSTITASWTPTNQVSRGDPTFKRGAEKLVFQFKAVDLYLPLSKRFQILKLTEYTPKYSHIHISRFQQVWMHFLKAAEEDFDGASPVLRFSMSIVEVICKSYT